MSQVSAPCHVVELLGVAVVAVHRARQQVRPGERGHDYIGHTYLGRDSRFVQSSAEQETDLCHPSGQYSLYITITKVFGEQLSGRARKDSFAILAIITYNIYVIMDSFAILAIIT